MECLSAATAIGLSSGKSDGSMNRNGVSETKSPSESPSSTITRLVIVRADAQHLCAPTVLLADQTKMPVTMLDDRSQWNLRHVRFRFEEDLDLGPQAGFDRRGWINDGDHRAVFQRRTILPHRIGVRRDFLHFASQHAARVRIQFDLDRLP